MAKSQGEDEVTKEMSDEDKLVVDQREEAHEQFTGGNMVIRMGDFGSFFMYFVLLVFFLHRRFAAVCYYAHFVRWFNCLFF